LEEIGAGSYTEEFVSGGTKLFLPFALPQENEQLNVK
jgi:hypothetical protein